MSLALVHLVHKLAATGMPQAAIAIAKATLIPQAYVWGTTSSSALENTWHRLMAPVAVMRAVSILGVALLSLCTSWLSKPDYAATIKNVALSQR